MSSVTNFFEWGCSRRNKQLVVCSSQAEHERLVAAESILVVGGGIVGVELAGEVIVNFPQKLVTLVCAGDRLIPDKPPSIGHRARHFLEERNVKVNRVSLPGVRNLLLLSIFHIQRISRFLG